MGARATEKCGNDRRTALAVASSLWRRRVQGNHGGGGQPYTIRLIAFVMQSNMKPP